MFLHAGLHVHQTCWTFFCGYVETIIIENKFSCYLTVFQSLLKKIFVVVALKLLSESYVWNVIDYIVSSYFDANRRFSESLYLQIFIDCRANKRRIFKKQTQL